MQKNIDEKNRVVKIDEAINPMRELMDNRKNSMEIRLDMNMIEFPIFTKSKNIKNGRKCTFSKTKSEYLEIIPFNENGIPGEFEEKIYLSLLKLFKDNKFEKTFYCSISQILDNITKTNGTRKSLYKNVKLAIEKMSKTTYIFSNIFYVNTEGKKKGKRIKGKVNINLISSEVIYKENCLEEQKHLFKDGRIKEVYKIEFPKEIYENLIKKGYIAFDLEKLMKMPNSITRSLYVKLTKWRNEELKITKNVCDIAEKIPLCMKPSSLKNTVEKISDSLKKLKELGELEDFEELKDDNKEVPKIKFCITFNHSHNEMKKKVFHKEREDFNNNFKVLDVNQNELKEEDKNESSDVLEIIEILGEKGKELKTLQHHIEKALKKYDFEYVKYAAEYAKIYAKTSISKYFKDTLEKNWHEEYTFDIKAKEEKKLRREARQEENMRKLEEQTIKPLPKHLNEGYEKLEKLSEEEKNDIEKSAYEKYLIEVGSSDNRVIRGIFEKYKKSLMLKELEERSTKTNISNLKNTTTEEIIERVSSIEIFSLEMLKQMDKMRITKNNYI